MAKLDDDKNIRLLIKKYAEFEGHEIQEADDGMKAESQVLYNLIANSMSYTDGDITIK